GVLKMEPPWETLPRETPTAIRRLLRRCLEKDPRGRLADASTVRLEVKDARRSPESDAAASATWPRRERLVLAAAVGFALVSIAAAAALFRSTRQTSPPAEIRLEITTPRTTDPVSLAISPDGTRVVYVASAGGQPRLWLRRLGSEAARPLRGTEGASFPFWSP